MVDKTETKTSFSSKTIGFFLGIVIFFVVWVSGIPGLNSTGAHATAIALLTAIWWIFMCMPPMIPALCACVLFMVTKTAKPVDAFCGFFHPTIWLLFFALVMAKGVEVSGLGKRIASIILSKVSLSFNGLVAAFIILCFILPFIVPSAAADVALLMALAVGIFDALDIEKNPKNKISAGLTCFVAILCLTFGRVPLTGSLPNFIAAGFVHDLAGISLGWLDWLTSMWIIAPIPAIGTYLYITRKYKPEEGLSREKMRENIQTTRENLGRMTVNERKAAIYISLAVILWAFGGFIKLPLDTNQIGIIIGMLFFLPYIGFLTIKDFNKMSLVTFFFAGGSFSIGAVLAKSGFAAWAGVQLMNFGFLHKASFFTAGLFILVFAFVLHFILETLGEVSLLAPVLLKMNILPAKAVGMLLPYGAGMYLFPYQATPIVLSLGFDTTGWMDIVKYGCFLTVLGLLQGALFLLTYWAWVLI
jgi:anion transporter